MEKKNEYVVLFPLMAQGRLIPFISLAHLTLQKGYSTIIVSTPLNTTNLRNSFPPPPSPPPSSTSTATVEFLSLPFTSSDHGLPPGVENTDSLPPNLIFPFVQSTTSLKLPFRSLLSDLVNSHGGDKPLYVVSDFFFGWAADAAHELGIPHYIFSVTGGFGMACFISMWMNLPHRRTDADEFFLPDFPEAGKMHITQVNSAMLAARENDPPTISLQKFFESWANSDGLLLNTVEEVDNIGVMHFHRKFGLPVWAIGPLLLPEEDRSRIGMRQSAINPRNCIAWLDKKQPNSVVYVSFGSQNTIPAPQMMKLAEALDASRRGFVWVVRTPLGFDINAEFLAEEWLPEGFLRRVGEEGRGLVVGKQVEILAHKVMRSFWWRWR